MVAPFLFLLIVGVFEAARLVFYYHTLNHATREGARYAIVHGDNALDGCPSGPQFGGNPCDPNANNVWNRILAQSKGVDSSGLDRGWPGDPDSYFLKYTWLDGSADNACGSGDMIGCNTHDERNVRVRAQYSYAPILLSDIFGSITLRAETTLVINN